MEHNSWVTQRMLNKLPPWSDARSLPFSFAQQYLNPTGEALEELSRYSINQRKSLYLTTANLDMLDLLYTLHLPADFQFGQDQVSINNVRYIVPQCRATTQDNELVWLESVDGNTLENFWDKALPTRVEFAGAYVDVVPVVDETEIGNIDLVVINEVCWPTRLAVTITDGTTFADLSRREVFSFIKLTGVTLRGLEEEEVMVIPYNGVFLTRKIWKEITSLECYGLEPSTATIRIDSFSFNKRREVDKYQLFVTPDSEKLLYHRIDSHDFTEGTFSVHQHLTVTADTLGQLYSGNDILQVVREYELLYNSTNLLLNDIAVQPFTGRIFGIDDNYLYVFEPYPEPPDYRGMRAKTSGCMMTLEADKYEFIRGESVTLSTHWRRPVQRIIRNRWSVIKPDGTVAYLDISGIESSVSSWIYNKTYTELIFGPFDSPDGDISTQEIVYNLTQRGTYLFKLETQYANDTVETDIIPVNVNSLVASKRLALPTGLRNCQGLSFDSDQKLWLIKQDTGGSAPYIVASGYDIVGRAFRIHLAVDNMLIDFDNKTIYMHENYKSVSVEETDDMVVEL